MGKVDLDMVGWKFMSGVNRGGWVKQCDWQQTVQDLSQLMSQRREEIWFAFMPAGSDGD